jgi:Cu/Ag efflux protein CusF
VLDNPLVLSLSDAKPSENIMKPQVIILATVLLGAAALPALSQTKPAATGAVVAASAPGEATIASTVSVSAKVVAIDAATRQVTLKGPKGNLNVVTAGPDVSNFDQIKVGDIVTVRYVEALTLTLKKGGKELRSSVSTPDSARAAAGERPAGVVANQTEVTANVIAVNAKTQTVTLRGPKQTVELKVPDAGQFKLIKVGDQIQAVYTEAVALSVEPGKK